MNAVYAIGGSTQAMLTRLHDLLGAHLADVDRRLAELGGLRTELLRYRDHVEERVEERVIESDVPFASEPVGTQAQDGALKKGMTR